MTEYSVIFHNVIFASIQRPANKWLVCYFPNNNNQEKMDCRIIDSKVVIREETFFFFDFMAPFYGWGSTASRLEPLRGGSLLFTTKFPEIPDTHFIDLGRMKG